MKAPRTKSRTPNAAGFTLIELMIVICIIAVVSGFALMQIARAQRVMVRENAARRFADYIEKARMDSLRRHPMTSAQMAQISIIDVNSYRVAFDANGDGALDAPQVVNLTPEGLKLNGPFPRTIYFNWRGRPVDAAGNVALPAIVTVSNDLTSQINLTANGQPTLQGPPPTSPVVNSQAPDPTFKSITQIP